MHIIQKPVKPYLIMYVCHVVAKCKRADQIQAIRRVICQRPVIYLQPPTQKLRLRTP